MMPIRRHAATALLARLVVLTILLAWAGAAVEAQRGRIDGTWKGEATAAAAPPFPVTMVFKTDGTSLTGHASMDEGPEVPLQDGVLEGDTISFWFEWFGDDAYCEGTAAGAEVTLKVATGIGITFDLVLTRAK